MNLFSADQGCSNLGHHGVREEEACFGHATAAMAAAVPVKQAGDGSGRAGGGGAEMERGEEEEVAAAAAATQQQRALRKHKTNTAAWTSEPSSRDSSSSRSANYGAGTHPKLWTTLIKMHACTQTCFVSTLTDRSEASSMQLSACTTTGAPSRSFACNDALRTAAGFVLGLRGMPVCFSSHGGLHNTLTLSVVLSHQHSRGAGRAWKQREHTRSPFKNFIITLTGQQYFNLANLHFSKICIFLYY